MRIAGDEVFVSCTDVREVAAAAARDNYFATDTSVAFEDENLATAPPGLDRTKQSGSAATDHNDVEL